MIMSHDYEMRSAAEDRIDLWRNQLLEARRLSKGLLQISEPDETHFQITTPDKDFLMCVWPSNRRIWSNPYFDKPPFLADLSEHFDLLELVEALVQEIRYGRKPR